MFKIHKEEIEINGKKITLETGKIARQADGAIIATCGETVVIATAVGAKEIKDGQDYFPLSVNYQEKYYAAGKIPGGYFKREARPTEAETLISRLIDRPIRPLFPSSFLNEVQIGLLTDKIVKLSEHFKKSKKDKHSTTGLTKSVNKRKKLLTYLKKKNVESYQKVIKQLNLRK